MLNTPRSGVLTPTLCIHQNTFMLRNFLEKTKSLHLYNYLIRLNSVHYTIEPLIECQGD
jgi:hypothetical protein